MRGAQVYRYFKTFGSTIPSESVNTRPAAFPEDGISGWLCLVSLRLALGQPQAWPAGRRFVILISGPINS